MGLINEEGKEKDTFKQLRTKLGILRSPKAAIRGDSLKGLSMLHSLTAPMSVLEN